MSSRSLQELIKEVDSLSTQEQLRLVAYLAERASRAYAPPRSSRKWLDLCGMAPDLLGEDAQAWVSHTRKESDEHRRVEMGD